MEFLILSYPIAWIIYKLNLVRFIPENWLTRTIQIMLPIGIIVLITPFSFYNVTAQIYYLSILLILVFHFVLMSNNENKTIRNSIKIIGKLSFPIVIVSAFVFLINPLFWSSEIDINGLKSKGITRLNHYSLDHYQKGSNFSYSGQHQISIKRTLIPYLLEYKVGEVIVGDFDQRDLPSHKLQIRKTSTNETLEYSPTQFNITDSYLIKSIYRDANYIVIDKYKF